MDTLSPNRNKLEYLAIENYQEKWWLVAYANREENKSELGGDEIVKHISVKFYCPVENVVKQYDNYVSDYNKSIVGKSLMNRGSHAIAVKFQVPLWYGKADLKTELIRRVKAAANNNSFAQKKKEYCTDCKIKVGYGCNSCPVYLDGNKRGTVETNPFCKNSGIIFGVNNPQDGEKHEYLKHKHYMNSDHDEYLEYDVSYVSFVDNFFTDYTIIMDCKFDLDECVMVTLKKDS